MKNKKPLIRILTSRIIAFVILLILSTVVYTAAVVFVFVLTQKDVDYGEDSIRSSLNSSDYSAVSKKIKKRDYFIIYNQSREIIYKSSSKSNSFTENGLSLIPYETNLEVVDSEISYTKDSIIHYNIRVYEDTSEFSYSDILVDEYVIEGNNVLYSSNEKVSSTISDEDIICLMGENSDFYISKVIFNDKAGNLSYAVFFKEKMGGKTFIPYLASLIIGYIIILIILVILYLYNQNKKLKKPLILLENNIKSYMQGKLVKAKYKGPKEFSDILDDFYSLTVNLEETKELNSKLTSDRKRLISDISHDLKTPISVIDGYIQAILDGKIDRNDIDKYLTIIKNKTLELNNLINTFREYSKLDRSDFVLSLTPININEYVRNYIVDKYSEIELADFQVNVNINSPETLINIDTFQMKRVFDNLIDNSLKYNKAGTTIYISVINYKYETRIKIGDDGIGISDSLKTILFNPFTLEDKSRTSGKGTGLGLSIAKKIIDKHSGTIELLSKEKSKVSVVFLITLYKNTKIKWYNKH